MIDFWYSPFVDHPFMQRALLAGTLTAICAGVVGTWVVLRGMAFLGDALAHGVLPGVALAFVIGVNPMLGGILSALLLAAGIAGLRQISPLPDDTSIGVLFVGFLALAVVIMSSGATAYAGDLNRFLFGSVTSVTASELGFQALVTAATVALCWLLRRPLLMLAFDPTQARLAGFRPGLTNALLLGMVAAAVVVSFQTVGNLLVFAFLVAPPAAASLVVRSVPRIMLTAAALGTLAVYVGLALSFRFDSAPGATMALCSVAEFGTAIGLRALRGALPLRQGLDVVGEPVGALGVHAKK